MPGLAIPTCITARASRTCRDACRDRLLAVSFGVGGGENVPCIPGACATRNFSSLARGPFQDANENQTNFYESSFSESYFFQYIDYMYHDGLTT